MKNINYFIEIAEKHFNDGFPFSKNDFERIINKLELENEQYEPITWEELKDVLIGNGHYECYWQELVVSDREEAKALGWIDEDDLDDDEYDEYIESLESIKEEYAEYVESMEEEYAEYVESELNELD